MTLTEPEPVPVNPERAASTPTSDDERAYEQQGGDVMVDTVLRCSRVMVRLADASVRQVTEDVTLAQYRTLVALAGRSRWRLGDLSSAMGVTPSTVSRMCDRLVHKQLVSRERDDVDRREVVLTLTERGRGLAEAITERSQMLVEDLLNAIPPSERASLVRSLALLNQVADRARTAQWPSGWSPD